jgi:ubiquinone/menaquinone biosynthesis C-methylase UbiE
MDRLRRVLKKVLPACWWDRIDLENASIREWVTKTAGETGAGERVLDAGSGQCIYREYFRHARYTGVDFASGETNWDYSGLDVIARLEALPFGDQVFDTVLCTQVLEHLAEPEEVLRELLRLTRPNGRLMLTAPLGFGEHQVPHDYFRYTRFGLRHLLEKAGWTVKRIVPRGGYFRYMAVMMMWFYIYLFPESRPAALKVLLFPFQLLTAVALIVVGAPLVQALDGLDHEKRITLGFAAECIRSDPSESIESDV